MKSSVIHICLFFLKKSWFILIVGVTILYPVYGTFLDEGIELSGVTDQTDTIEASWETLSDGEYQSSINSLWENEFPGRKFLIRLRNQFMYGFLNKSPNNNVIIGKDGYLFEPLYVYQELAINGSLGSDKINGLGDRLLELRNLLAGSGKELYIFITPSKAHYYTDKIPSRYMILDRRQEFPESDLSLFKKALDERGIFYFDSNAYIDETLNNGSPWEAPLFYKNGIHWSHTWGLASAGAFLSYMNSNSRFDLSEVEISEARSDTPVAPDTDLYLSLNLLREAKEDWYSADMQISYEGADRPDVFLRGGSFLGQSLGTWFSSGVFKKGVHLQNQFYFLDDSNVPNFLSARNAYDEMDLKALMGKADILVLEVNASVIENMSWQFIDELLAHPEYLENPYAEIAAVCTPGKRIYFKSEDTTGFPYVQSGLAEAEENYTWTSGKEVELCFRLTSDAPVIKGDIGVANIFRDEQLVNIFVNNKRVFSQVINGAGVYSFEFENPADHIIHFIIDLPMASSPKDAGISEDERILSLALSSMILEESN